MWEKIVFNLIANALKFTFKGEISVALRSGGDDVELAVSDSGIGIPADEIPHLFERFYRVKNARSRTQEGTGIGLALVQELVRLHGGTIAVTSEPDKGSTFTVRLPKGTAHLPKDRIGAERTLVSTGLGAAPYVEEALQWVPTTLLDRDVAARPHGGPEDEFDEELPHSSRRRQPGHAGVSGPASCRALAGGSSVRWRRSA